MACGKDPRPLGTGTNYADTKGREPVTFPKGPCSAAGPLLSVAPGAARTGVTSGSGTLFSGRDAEQSYIDHLKEKYPKLRNLDIRPRARPSSSKFTALREDLYEAGGSPEYRIELTGAPEFAFEERMQTSQGKYSYGVYDRMTRSDGTVRNVLVFEIDGISVDGWLEAVKIEQKFSSVDDILAQLRRQANFAETYGLKGVRYSIAPPDVADEVERRVAEERLKNVYRVE